MSREHPGHLRLYRGPFSGRWYAVRVAEDGHTVTDKWELHADDQAHLEEVKRNVAIVTRLRNLVKRYKGIHNGSPSAPGSRERIYYGVTTDLEAILAGDDAPAPSPDSAAVCNCVCHTTPGIAHVLPCCVMSGIVRPPPPDTTEEIR